MAISTLYEVVTVPQNDEPITYLDLEDHDVMDRMSLRNYGPSYDNGYSSFTAVPKNGLSIIIHEYYADSGSITQFAQYIDQENHPEMKFISGITTFTSYSSLINEGGSK
jgi:hypothetical protein